MWFDACTLGLLRVCDVIPVSTASHAVELWVGKSLANKELPHRANPLDVSIVYRTAMTQTNLLQGTLDLLILKTLTLGELHGLGVARRIEQITQGTFQVKPGSLFPALHRMEAAGWVTSAFGKSENQRDAKYYKLTSKGLRQLREETDEWSRIATAMNLALRTT